MAIFNIPLSLTTIPVLLMLVGYSVDTDIMLTTKLLKRKEGGSPNKRVVDAMKTGLIMTSTTLGAMLSMLVVSYVYNITDIFYMAIVLICGLIVDLLSTWLMNAPVLLWYVESKKK
jgi:preprotein translocase subunit SecF